MQNSSTKELNNQAFGIYIIGDEILSGKLEDKHLTQAISILKARGLPLGWQSNWERALI